jgi:hypothetical protein
VTAPHVIILAQGTQKRLGNAHGYKQLLPLPACGNVPILIRTLRQLAMMFKSWTATIVTWDALIAAVPPTWQLFVNSFEHVQLLAPGNSSLKGIARYLEDQRMNGAYAESEGTIVLLGDVMYSWACLAALERLTDNCGFVGTSGLAGGGGELWGVAWHLQREGSMLRELADALLRHPPIDDEYQPGQLRRWIVGMRRGDVAHHVARMVKDGRYLPIDDYTMDVDLPRHVPLLGPASEAAARDDADHGLTWSTP